MHHVSNYLTRNSKIKNSFGVLNLDFEFWKLFEICDLLIGIFSPYLDACRL